MRTIVIVRRMAYQILESLTGIKVGTVIEAALTLARNKPHLVILRGKVETRLTIDIHHIGIGIGDHSRTVVTHILRTRPLRLAIYGIRGKCSLRISGLSSIGIDNGNGLVAVGILLVIVTLILAVKRIERIDTVTQGKGVDQRLRYAHTAVTLVSVRSVVCNPRGVRDRRTSEQNLAVVTALRVERRRSSAQQRHKGIDRTIVVVNLEQLISVLLSQIDDSLVGL